MNAWNVLCVDCVLKSGTTEVAHLFYFQICENFVFFESSWYFFYKNIKLKIDVTATELSNTKNIH
jgi:hypothetical protein